MIKSVSIAVLFALSATVASAAVAAGPREASARPAAVATLGERGGWGLVIGIASLGLALRCRRAGPIVTD